MKQKNDSRINKPRVRQIQQIEAGYSKLGEKEREEMEKSKARADLLQLIKNKAQYHKPRGRESNSIDHPWQGGAPGLGKRKQMNSCRSAVDGLCQ